jgi:phosphatidylinositol N-acetylglucosaminyltransferase subunit Q
VIFSSCLIPFFTAILPPITPVHITTLGTLSSFGGFTLLLSLLSDLLSLLLTAHLRLAYELACGVYWGAGVKLGGGLLWGVFRGTCPCHPVPEMQLNLIVFFPCTKGKRRNVLRNRTDTWSYDIDQLLFGTVLFTLIAFLFPTALVYYVLFAGVGLSQFFHPSS